MGIFIGLNLLHVCDWLKGCQSEKLQTTTQNIHYHTMKPPQHSHACNFVRAKTTEQCLLDNLRWVLSILPWHVDCDERSVLCVCSDHFRMTQLGADSRKHHVHKKYMIDVLLTGNIWSGFVTTPTVPIPIERKLQTSVEFWDWTEKLCTKGPPPPLPCP